MFELIYEIWCITDAFLAQLIVFDYSQDNNSIDDDDDNLYNGDLDELVTQT